MKVLKLSAVFVFLCSGFLGFPVQATAAATLGCPNSLGSSTLAIGTKGAGAAPTGEVSLVINTDQRTLTVFSNGFPYRVFPVAVGKAQTPSPLGEWTIVYKGDSWGGGFGTRWMGLSVPWGIYGIHGTNKPGSIGAFASHGCFRMFNRDAETLFRWVRVGTPVGVIGTPTRRSLYQGDRGFEVLEVQARLGALGLYRGKVDGVFGPTLTRAIVSFQRAEKLKADGNIGPAIYKALGLMPPVHQGKPVAPDGWTG